MLLSASVTQHDTYFFGLLIINPSPKVSIVSSKDNINITNFADPDKHWEKSLLLSAKVNTKTKLAV